MIPSFGLRATLSPNANNDLDDVWWTKTALRDLGFYRRPVHGMTTYPDVEMFDALRRFQGREGLTVDGVMRPDGPLAASPHATGGGDAAGAAGAAAPTAWVRRRLPRPSAAAF